LRELAVLKVDVAQDVLQNHRFQSGEDLEQTILRYITLYNQQLPQAANCLNDALAGDDRLAQTHARAVQKPAILPHRM
jgi:hypothetical protein